MMYGSFFSHGFNIEIKPSTWYNVINIDDQEEYVS